MRGMPLRIAEIVAAAIAAALGWIGIGLLLLGPTYSVASSTIDASGAVTSSAGTRSLLEMGVSPVTAAILVACAIGFAILLLGAWLHAVRARRGARWLVAVGALPAVAVTLVSFGAGPFLLPGAAVGLLAAMLAWSPRRALRA